MRLRGPQGNFSKIGASASVGNPSGVIYSVIYDNGQFVLELT